MSSKKLEKIEEKIKDLQKKKQKLQEKRSERILKLINKANLSEIDEKTLSGALFFVKQEIDDNSELAQSWHIIAQTKQL